MRAVQASIANAEEQINTVKMISDLAPAATKVLAAFKDEPGQRLSRRQVVAVVELPVRTVARALATLTENDLLQKYGGKVRITYQLVF